MNLFKCRGIEDQSPKRGKKETRVIADISVCSNRKYTFNCIKQHKSIILTNHEKGITDNKLNLPRVETARTETRKETRAVHGDDEC